MADGIRATVEFPPPGPCPIADLADAADATVDEVWVSVSPGGSVPSVSEFVLESTTPPTPGPAEHVLTEDDRHHLRLVHGGGEPCPCECIGRHGCAVRRYVARPGSLRLVFDAADYDELHAVIGSLRDRFPDLEVRRLLRTPTGERPRDAVVVDRGRLTDRQLEVLRTAYRMGYFERPRRANATDVATELDIAASTFAEHLATAESKLLGDLLEEDRDGAGT